MQTSSKNTNYRSPWVLVLLCVLVGLPSDELSAQESSSQQLNVIAVLGQVRNTAGEPIPGVSVLLKEKGQTSSAETTTNASGAFTFSLHHPGAYALRVHKNGFRPAIADPLVLSPGEGKHIDLTLETLPGLPSPGAMEFEDKPNFAIAGVTDWTAAGGHGADTNLRTSEELAKETLALKSDGLKNSLSERKKTESENKLRATLVQTPGSFEANYQLGAFYLQSKRYREAVPFLDTAHQINPTNRAAAYDLAKAYKANGDFEKARALVRDMIAVQNDADLHRLLSDIDEQLNDPVGAVQEYEQATRLDPSEQNYFDWGSDLLLHRAVEPAVEVFGKGSIAHPKSARMLSGLGAALYANGAYAEAAQRVCAASDLTPTDPTPYLFLGKMESAAPDPLPCVEQRMARLVKNRPGDALANYYYAMTLWKRQKSSQNPAILEQVHALLEKAVSIDPKCDKAYLQLGILEFDRGNLEQAVAAYKKASEFNSGLPEAHYRLGIAYKRLGKDEDAEQEFQLHQRMEKTDAAAIDRQRRDVKQFLFTLSNQPGPINLVDPSR